MNDIYIENNYSDSTYGGVWGGLLFLCKLKDIYKICFLNDM